MNPLQEYPQIRKILYIVQWIINLGMGIGGIVVTMLDQSPMWFIILGACLNFVWSYTGLTASANTPPEGE